MALQDHGCLFNCARLSLLLSVLVLVVHPHIAYGSSRGSVGITTNNAIQVPPELGICATSVVVHGYKCQEFEVSVLGFVPHQCYFIARYKKCTCVIIAN